MQIYDEDKEKTKKIPKFDEEKLIEKKELKYNTILNCNLKEDI